MRSLRFLLLAATPFVISACASIVGFPDVPDIEDGGTTEELRVGRVAEQRLGLPVRLQRGVVLRHVRPGLDDMLGQRCRDL